MNNSISSIERPLLFFEDLLNYKSLEAMIESFREYSPFKDFDTQNLIAFEYEVDNFGDHIKIEVEFAQHLLIVLNKETLISIKLIDQFFRPNLEEVVSTIKINNVLDIIYSHINGIPQNLPIKVQYIIKQSLFEILSHIYKKYGNLDFSHPAIKLLKKSEDDPIIKILGYLKGENDHGLLIMIESEYERLIKTIKDIIRYKKIPEGIKKFHINGVPSGVLRYTFYLVLPYLDDLRNSFLHFLHDNIDNFQSGSFDYFYTKISVPPNVIPDYLPQIIREKKQQQINKSK